MKPTKCQESFAGIFTRRGTNFTKMWMVEQMWIDEQIFVHKLNCYWSKGRCLTLPNKLNKE